MQRPELILSVSQAVTEIANLNGREVKESDRLREDLGLDSLQSMELLSRLSEDFDIDPDMDDVMGVETIGGVVDFLAGYLPGDAMREPA